MQRFRTTFTRHFGFSADADLLRSDYVQFREYGFRAGPTVRFFQTARMEPFARALIGYSRFKETITGPNEPYVSGVSYLVGMGDDVRLAGPVWARVAGDYEQNSSVGPKATRLLRISFGFTYKFNRFGW